MTQREFNKQFKENFPNYKRMTTTDRRLTYNDMMEAYRRNHQITERQAQTWGHPEFITNRYQF